MKIQKSYKLRFYPTKPQIEQLSKEFGCARWVWNRGLLERNYAYSEWGVRLSSTYDIRKNITQYKKSDYPWLSEASYSVLTQKLIDQDKEFDNFFKGRAKYPKFKKKSL